MAWIKPRAYHWDGTKWVDENGMTTWADEHGEAVDRLYKDWPHGKPEAETMPEGRDPEEILREQQVLWVAGYHDVGVRPGSFYQALIEAAFRADAGNLALIELGFPLVVLAVRRWTQGPLAAWYGVEI